MKLYKYDYLLMNKVIVNFSRDDYIKLAQIQNAKNGYPVFVYLTTFIHTKKLNERDQVSFRRKSLRIKIYFEDIVTKERVYKAISLHANQSSPYIQRYENLRKEEAQEWKKLQIQAQLYQCTLKYVLDQCKKKSLKLPEKSSEYLIICILEIYKYVIYLCQTFDIQGLTYDPSIQNLGFNKEYKLILLYPCINKNQIIHPLKATNKEINFGFRKIMKQTLKRLKECCEKYKDFGLIDFIEGHEDSEFTTIEEEKKYINHYHHSLIKNSEIPESLFKFLHDIILVKQSQDPIIKWFKEQEIVEKNTIHCVMANRAHLQS